jgi:hypothetical protein
LLVVHSPIHRRVDSTARENALNDTGLWRSVPGPRRTGTSSIVAVAPHFCLARATISNVIRVTLELVTPLLLSRHSL